MQEQNPKISVICYFHNQLDQIDATLQTLSAIREVDCELFIINDGSEDTSSEAILQHLERYRPQKTFFLEQEPSQGRGMSLSRVLEHVNHRFLWIPESLVHINENHLAEAARALLSTEAAFAVGTYDDPPARASSWIQLVLNEQLPSDRVFIFDREKIPAEALYFDPHWSSHHASELALRLQNEYDFLSVTPFVAEGDDLEVVEDSVLRESAMALLRSGHLSLTEKKSALRMLVDPGHAKKHSISSEPETPEEATETEEETIKADTPEQEGPDSETPEPLPVPDSESE
ncbi:glycosyltransferase family A protein, partial [Balneolaceae bacterium ANBcel3]|nr:glycosyltransferase family A protein [Balneolaceae bacterium ANBcel3]